MNKQLMSWEEAVLAFRSNSDNVEAVHACFYDDPILDAAERYHASSEFNELLKHIPKPPGILLDLGAGRGISSYAFAKEGWNVSALEPDPSTVVGSGAIRTLTMQPDIDIFIVEDWGERLPFEDSSFDIVHGRAVFHHANDLMDFCSEAARVLRPGGMLVALREHVITHDTDREKFLDQHPLHSLYGGENAFKRKDYRSAIEQAGLVIEKELNPWASEINLYPETFDSLRLKIGQTLKMPGAFPVPNLILKLLGNVYNQPGRLFSYFAIKPIQ